MENLQRLTEIFEMDVPGKTVPFDSRPKISEFYPNGSQPKSPFPNDKGSMCAAFFTLRSNVLQIKF